MPQDIFQDFSSSGGYLCDHGRGRWSGSLAPYEKLKLPPANRPSVPIPTPTRTGSWRCRGAAARTSSRSAKVFLSRFSASSWSPILISTSSRRERTSLVFGVVFPQTTFVNIQRLPQSGAHTIKIFFMVTNAGKAGQNVSGLQVPLTWHTSSRFPTPAAASVPLQSDFWR